MILQFYQKCASKVQIKTPMRDMQRCLDVSIMTKDEILYGHCFIEAMSCDIHLDFYNLNINFC